MTVCRSRGDEFFAALVGCGSGAGQAVKSPPLDRGGSGHGGQSGKRQKRNRRMAPAFGEQAI